MVGKKQIEVQGQNGKSSKLDAPKHRAEPIADRVLSREEKNRLNAKLFDSVREGDANKVVQLLRAGADPDPMDQYDRTPLCEANHLDIQRILIRAGADENYARNYRTGPTYASQDAHDRMTDGFMNQMGWGKKG